MKLPALLNCVLLVPDYGHGRMQLKPKKPLIKTASLAIFIYVSLFMIIPNSASSQELILGLNAGFNRSRLGQNYIVDGSASDGTTVRYQTYTRTGVSFGPTIEYSSSRWSLQSSLSLVVKGNRGNSRSLNPEIHPNNNLDGELRINYLQVPVIGLYKIKLSNLVLFVGGGPYLELGLSGKSLLKGNWGDYKQDSYQRVEFNSEPGGTYYNPNIKRIDGGMTGHIGVDLLKNVNLSAAYEHGLFKSKYRVFGLTMGYRLFALKKSGERRDGV